MTTPPVSLLSSEPIPGPVKRKRVLLVDGCAAKRELRAEALRKLGTDVDCACDISEARSWWRADLYNLVLINVDGSRHRDKFCEDVRAARPPQQLAFLVGQPEYLAQSPNLMVATAAEQELEAGAIGKRETERAVAALRAPSLTWGIMEASRRISAVRSVSVARATAIRNRPTPPRDVELTVSRRDEIMSQLASELQKEELL